MAIPQSLIWNGDALDYDIVGSVGEELFVTIGPWLDWGDPYPPRTNLLKLWRAGNPPTQLDSYQIPLDEYVGSNEYNANHPWSENDSGTIALVTQGAWDGPEPYGFLYVITSDGASLIVDRVAMTDWSNTPMVSGDGKQVWADYVRDIGNLSSTHAVTLPFDGVTGFGYAAGFPRENRLVWVNNSPASLTYEQSATGTNVSEGIAVNPVPLPDGSGTRHYMQYKFNYSGWNAIPALDPDGILSRTLQVHLWFNYDLYGPPPPNEHYPPGWVGTTSPLIDLTDGYIFIDNLQTSWAMDPTGHYGEVYVYRSLPFSLSGDYTFYLRAFLNEAFLYQEWIFWSMYTRITTEYDNSGANGGRIELRDLAGTVINHIPFTDPTYFYGGDNQIDLHSLWVETKGGTVLIHGTRTDMSSVQYRMLSTAGDVLAWTGPEKTLVTNWEGTYPAYIGGASNYTRDHSPVIAGCWDGVLALAPRYTGDFE